MTAALPEITLTNGKSVQQNEVHQKHQNVFNETLGKNGNVSKKVEEAFLNRKLLELPDVDYSTACCPVKQLRLLFTFNEITVSRTLKDTHHSVNQDDFSSLQHVQEEHLASRMVYCWPVLTTPNIARIFCR